MKPFFFLNWVQVTVGQSKETASLIAALKATALWDFSTFIVPFHLVHF